MTMRLRQQSKMQKPLFCTAHHYPQFWPVLVQAQYLRIANLQAGAQAQAQAQVHAQAHANAHANAHAHAQLKTKLKLKRKPKL